MKRIFLFLFIVLFLSSCTPSTEGIISHLSYDTSLPLLLDYKMLDNSHYFLTFNENVEIMETLYDKKNIYSGVVSSSFVITFPTPLKAGDEKELFITIKKDNGNTLRCVFKLYGRNENIPRMIINEVSIKGTDASPDRIELLVLEDGNTLGMSITDDINDAGYIFPSLDVKEGDIIVLSWDKNIYSVSEERLENNNKTYYLFGKMSTTLVSTSGGLILSSYPSGDIIDAIIYANGEGLGYEEFSNDKAIRCAKYIYEKSEWIGEALNSTNVTSSRVFCRFPTSLDTNSKDDWFICAPRKSTFGEYNVYAPYEEK